MPIAEVSLEKRYAQLTDRFSETQSMFIFRVLFSSSAFYSVAVN
jgi:hypothetical protein